MEIGAGKIPFSPLPLSVPKDLAGFTRRRQQELLARIL